MFVSPETTASFTQNGKISEIKIAQENAIGG
jgi:hypothetical protein